MNAATLLIILLTHQGYWFGGQEQSVSIAWAVDHEMPKATLQWELMLGDVRLTGDQLNMPDGNKSAIVKMKPPVVRAQTQMRWTYRVSATNGGKLLASGEKILNVFPPIALADIAPAMGKKKLFIVDTGKELSALLADAKIDASRVESTGDLQSAQADLILVAANQLSDSPFAQSPLLAQARAGAQVMILEQKQPQALCGYNLSRKPVSDNITWRNTHPLFDGFEEVDLKSWLIDATEIWAVRLPVDEPAYEIVYWPRESPGKEPAPIDALVVAKAVGKGRLVLCQIPLQAWTDDPRSQMFLKNALNYLMTRPEPTPPPSERPTTQPAVAVPIPTITIPSGDQP